MRTVLKTGRNINVNRGRIKASMDTCHKVQLNRSQEGTPAVTGDFRLLENSDFRITETGDFRTLE